MKSGARLPLLLLLNYVIAVAGVLIWVVLSAPETPPLAVVVPAEKKAHEKPASDSNTAAEKPQPLPSKIEPPPAASAPEAEPRTEPRKKSAAETADKTPTAPEKPAAEEAKKDPTALSATTPPPDKLEPGENSQKTAQKTAPKSIDKRRARPDLPIVSKALPRAVSDDPLPPVPDTGLVQMTAIGPLPRVGDDGRRPVDVYAKPFDRSQKRPRIGIVVTGLGLSDAATESAIQGLAGGVTLAFAPYSSKLNEWIRLARAGGHEVLINIPMEPVNYPAYDPGPQTLLTSLNANSNLDRLFWALSRATGYVGVVDFLGSRFTVSRTHMVPVLKALKQRGLMYLDSGSTSLSIAPAVARQIGMSFAASALTLDERASRKDIDQKFGELEKRARLEKQAIGIASPYPVTLERIANWTHQLRARGFVLAPVSALTSDTATAKKP